MSWGTCNVVRAEWCNRFQFDSHVGGFMLCDERRSPLGGFYVSVYGPSFQRGFSFLRRSVA